MVRSVRLWVLCVLGAPRDPRAEREMRDVFLCLDPEGGFYTQSCRAARMVARPKPFIHFIVVEPGVGMRVLSNLFLRLSRNQRNPFARGGFDIRPRIGR